MPKAYTPEEIEKILESLPEELKEAFFSLETAEVINNTCKKYGITDERVGQIADEIGQVLMGLLLPSDFQKTIQEKTGLPGVLSKAITQEINRFVFYPVKPALEQLYKIEITPSEKLTAKPEIEEKTTATPPKEDIYKEPIE